MKNEHREFLNKHLTQGKDLARNLMNTSDDTNELAGMIVFAYMCGIEKGVDLGTGSYTDFEFATLLSERHPELAAVLENQ